MEFAYGKACSLLNLTKHEKNNAFNRNAWATHYAIRPKRAPNPI